MVRRVERYAIVPFRSRLNRQMVNMSTERLRSRLNTKQNWYTIVPFPFEQPICSFQKLERRWNGTIAFPFKLFRSVGWLSHGTLQEVDRDLALTWKVGPRRFVVYILYAKISLLRGPCWKECFKNGKRSVTM